MIFLQRLNFDIGVLYSFKNRIYSGLIRNIKMAQQKWLIARVLCFVVLYFSANMANSQSNNDLLNRISRLESEMSDLNRHLFQKRGRWSHQLVKMAVKLLQGRLLLILGVRLKFLPVKVLPPKISLNYRDLKRWFAHSKVCRRN